VVGLVGFGVVMVYSASLVEAITVFRDPQHFLKRQAVFAAIALTIMFGVSRLDYVRLRPLTYLGLIAVVLMMVLSVAGFGHTGGGAARWLRLGPIHIQPSEAAKLALVLWLGYSLDKKRERVKSFSLGMLPHFMMAGVLVLLCMKQPDFGGAAVLMFLTFSMLFVAGARLQWLVGAAGLGAGFAVLAVRFTQYRWERMVAWFNMADHRQDLAYQPFQAVMSFGSGELTGMGLGGGLQVLYLPEAHTDFVAAIIGEELGFLGVLGLCSVYLLVVVRGVRIAFAADDDYGSYIAFGISIMFGVQALVNLGVAMAILPTKGLTLPFVSYGGSSLLVNGLAMGILLSVSRRQQPVENVRIDAGPRAEVSAVLVSETQFAGGEPADPPRAAKPRASRGRKAARS
ncbi:MAG TPA: putative lipid II flippase FtsW, partial [Polyangiaceae bacterium]|nr:putative lipid II flippase FtsW [Polyangiaceae bacterium]